jgi:hypothetical protein
MKNATGERRLGWTRLVLQTAAIGLGVVLYSVFIFDRGLDSPLVYISLGTAVFLVVASVVSRTGMAFKAVLFNLAVLALAVGAAEAYLGGWLPVGRGSAAAPTLKHEGEFFGRIGGGYFVPDEVRGYAAEPKVRAHEKVRMGDRLLQDVVYTTNAHGLRIAPHDLVTIPAVAAGEHENVVFFGCSVTVGEGVNDGDTMPWAFETRSGGKYWTYNFGFHGYGPHQMLRILETGLIDKFVPDTPPTTAVYQGLMEHIERSAGNYPAVSWGPAAPRYALRQDGTPEYRGPFHASHGSAVFSVLNQSHIFAEVAPAILGWRRTQTDIDLYVAVVKRSKELFEARNGGRFSVVMWSAYDRDYPVVVERLRQAGIRVFEVHKIIPDIYTADWKYKLNGDEHPNAVTHALIAKFLLEAL